jgi:hypothetical protein
MRIQFDGRPTPHFPKGIVVADNDAGKGCILEHRLEPLDSGQVEMIGGFVEHQDVRLLHQRLDNGEPLFPSAGKAAGHDRKSMNPGAAAISDCFCARSSVGSPEDPALSAMTDPTVSSAANSGDLGDEAHARALTIATSPLSGSIRPDRMPNEWICLNRWGRSGRCDRLRIP